MSKSTKPPIKRMRHLQALLVFSDENGNTQSMNLTLVGFAQDGPSVDFNAKEIEADPKPDACLDSDKVCLPPDILKTEVEVIIRGTIPGSMTPTWLTQVDHTSGKRSE